MAVRSVKKASGLLAVFLVVLVSGGAAALVASEKPAEAAFPGDNGRIAFSTFRGSDFFARIYVVNPNGSGVRALPTPDGSYDPEWSSDGRRLVFRDYTGSDIPGEGDSDTDIYAINADGSGLRNLTKTPDVAETKPAWYPSGRRIAFSASSDGDYEIFSLPLDASGRVAGPARRLTDNDTDDYPSSVSPDGKKLAFYSIRDGDFEVYVMGADRPEGPDNVPAKLTDNDLHDLGADFSPDGKKLAYTWGVPATPDTPVTERYRDVYTMNADGSGKKNLTPGSQYDAFYPAWSPTGSKIAFRRTGGIWRMWDDGSHKVEVIADSGYDAPAWRPIPRN